MIRSYLKIPKPTVIIHDTTQLVGYLFKFDITIHITLHWLELIDTPLLPLLNILYPHKNVLISAASLSSTKFSYWSFTYRFGPATFISSSNLSNPSTCYLQMASKQRASSQPRARKQSTHWFRSPTSRPLNPSINYQPKPIQQHHWIVPHLLLRLPTQNIKTSQRAKRPT